jgi:rod shape-determining protein MreD
MIGAPSPEVLRAPPDGRLIAASLVIGYALSLLPWSGALLLIRPDFTLLVLLYWAIHEPRRVGQSATFGFGLLADVADGSLLGLHGLSYSVAIYLALKFRLRVQSFNLWQQALHLLPILLAAQGLTVLLNVVLHKDFPGWSLFLGSVLGALLWPALALIMEYPQTRATTSDTP